MIPADDPLAPKYWMNETSGVLRPVIEKLLDQHALDSKEMTLLRFYFKQWICSPAWDDNPFQTPEGARRVAALRETVDSITTMLDVAHWLKLAVDEGIDPL